MVADLLGAQLGQLGVRIATDDLFQVAQDVLVLTAGAKHGRDVELFQAQAEARVVL